MKNLFTAIFILLAVLILADKRELCMAGEKQIQLPQPASKGNVSVEEAIAGRRSQRLFGKKELTLAQIGQLLWAGQGITQRKGGLCLRSAPSAGALYPIEIYALTGSGAYHYMPQEQALEVLGTNDLRNDLCSAAWNQRSVSRAPLDIVVCAVYDRVCCKYGERGRRYAAIEAGHIAQNIHLQAVALGLASVPIGAFSDEKVKEVLSLSGDCQPLYIIPVGYAE